MEFNNYLLRKWSVQVRRRDGNRCVLCGARDGSQAHHINDKSNHPEQAYWLRNGVTLCSRNRRGGKRCHILFHTVFMKGTRYKCTRDDWHRFKELHNLLFSREHETTCQKNQQVMEQITATLVSHAKSKQ